MPFRSVVRRLSSDQSGISLIEWLVAMFVFGIVITLIANLYVSTTRAMDNAQNTNQNTRSASNAMNEMARMLRAGTDNPVSSTGFGAPPPNDPAFVYARNESVLFYAFVNLTGTTQQPIQVRLRIDSATRQLLEDTWPATSLGNGYWSFPAETTAPQRTRILADVIAPKTTGSSWTFTYLDVTNTPIPTGAGTGGGVANVKTTLASIASVQLTVTVLSRLGVADHQVTLQNTVGLPNLGLNRTIS
ncbi:prepilin-type N-terminal cleavage/methylation domain-containing protein [Leifsonia sp. fls2-241-R2A-40a]|uniref:type IV pilus modification PilV family protein n=1 Tax=Leifsonia sp. fls2-241-R2A-40a TaxID=3040290 RepID=UPI00254EDE8B|nr:prepilin-type N-terminal cleavage/methylation domain-containing protein [Leifsonia sp. fls2-241-R2A-40a]